MKNIPIELKDDLFSFNLRRIYYEGYRTKIRKFKHKTS